MPQPSLSVIIPAYNEERTLASIVEIVRTWAKASEIIIVNDGSTDNTPATLKHFGKKIILINLPQNKGKSFAVAEGVIRASGKLIMLLDADLLGLTHRVLDEFLKPMNTHKYDMVIGTPRAHGLGDQKFYHQLSGERVLKRSDLLKFIPAMRGLGYGLEVFLNFQFSQKRTFYTPLPDVYLVKRFEKYDFFTAQRGYLKEIYQVAKQIFLQSFSSLH